MSGELDAAGLAIEGALLGASIEPEHGAPVESGSAKICLNCQSAIDQNYCSQCGQKAEVPRTLSAIWHDILHSVLHFDGKLWRTLPMLAFKPGELTRRYIHGERAKFVSPMAMFLFSIFLMFAVFSFGATPDGQVRGNWQADLAKEAVKLDKDIAETEAKLANADTRPSDAEALQSKLDDLKSERNGIAWAMTGKPVYPSSEAGSGFQSKIGDSKSDTGWLWLDKKLNEGGKKLIENPSLTFYKLQTNGYKFAWLLIPLSLPFVWLVTLGVRGHHFYDHAVFATYSITFMCFLFVVTSLIDWMGANPLTGAFLSLIPPLHLYKQLRHSYGLTRLGAVIRMIPLMISIMIVAISFLLILLFMGMM
jgi:hypothetical protein